MGASMEERVCGFVMSCRMQRWRSTDLERLLIIVSCSLQFRAMLDAHTNICVAHFAPRCSPCRTVTFFSASSCISFSAHWPRSGTMHEPSSLSRMSHRYSDASSITSERFFLHKGHGLRAPSGTVYAHENKEVRLSIVSALVEHIRSQHLALRRAEHRRDSHRRRPAQPLCRSPHISSYKPWRSGQGRCHRYSY